MQFPLKFNKYQGNTLKFIPLVFIDHKSLFICVRVMQKYHREMTYILKIFKKLWTT